MKRFIFIFNIILSFLLPIQFSLAQDIKPTASTESTITIIKTPTQLEREERIKNDWANLARFRDENAQRGAPAKGEMRLVLMGDSITEGWSRVYPQFLAGKPYINRGISGQTTPQMLVRFRADVIALKPKVVVILGGTNDIAGNTGPSTLEMIEDNLASIAELAKANGIKVILASVLPVYDYPWKRGLNPAEKIATLNEWIKDYAKKKKMIYLDYYSPMVDERKGLKSEYSKDGVHPNEAGYKLMAPLTEKAITKALRQK
ncbi:MAG: SGNH/GDSL hydrolase family protein [bacterium]|nr:SGNH/GDSL hydrolase family protein [bacterium]